LVELGVDEKYEGRSDENGGETAGQRVVLFAIGLLLLGSVVTEQVILLQSILCLFKKVHILNLSII